MRVPAGGIVTLSEELFYSGYTLFINHGFGISSSFLHLSEVLVEHGDEVKQRDIIGKVGATGRVTGPHLDWRLNWFEKTYLNPEFLVEPMNEKAEQESPKGLINGEQDI